MAAAPKEWTGEPIRVGVIGGSGLYKLSNIEVVDQVYPETPWGFPSSPITIGRSKSGNLFAFLARHGLHHAIPPSKVPSLANIAALKHLGVRAILAFSAVGSLREEIAPKDFVVPSQIIDRTKGIRRASFFGEGEEENVVAHATFGDPFDETLRHVVEGIVRVHANKTTVCMEGPQFSTRAESVMYRQVGGDIINMSALPEAKLAREAEISYVLIATATDYDSWRESNEAVSVAEVLESLRANVAASEVVTLALLDKVHDLVKDEFATIVRHMNGSMRFSVMTKPEFIKPHVIERLRYVLPWFGEQS
ncbi:S-methyl-5'-thioadenosine phosphorylase [Malassezia cuniculi]|uniref:S-methyl-5'-thioadenosine phosphorylase n=1 Tax=Malassezia cuniculi TaxID=948313 RepID=A0AAF0EVK7_9BASI|nr:S-methyl-5'-thioadenosine phosphorylase [Malassezia cuniculi]